MGRMYNDKDSHLRGVRLSEDSDGYPVLYVIDEAGDFEQYGIECLELEVKLTPAAMSDLGRELMDTKDWEVKR